MTLPVIATVAFALGALLSVVAFLLLLVVAGTHVGLFLVVVGGTLLALALMRLVEHLSGRKRDLFSAAFFGTGLHLAGVTAIVVYLLLQ